MSPQKAEVQDSVMYQPPFLYLAITTSYCDPSASLKLSTTSPKLVSEWHGFHVLDLEYRVTYRLFFLGGHKPQT